MRNLAPLLELAARVVREHPDAPELCSVDVDHYGDRPEVRLYTAWNHDRLRLVARWALALRTTVEITPHSSFHEATATRLVDVDTIGPVRVVVWTRLEPTDVVTLARRVGVVVDADGGPVEITPRRLLAALDAVPTEDRVA